MKDHMSKFRTLTTGTLQNTKLKPCHRNSYPTMQLKGQLQQTNLPITDKNFATKEKGFLN
jgi:hypothetical protein